MKIKPNKAHIKQWIRALRSGRYKQTVETLRKDDEPVAYCCLGVACNISKLGKWDGDGEYKIGTRSYNGFLPHPVAKWLGLSRDPTLPVGDRKRQSVHTMRRKVISAVTANDYAEWDFKDIANALEERYIKGK